MHNMAASSAVARGDLKNAVIASTPGGIEKQEKEGKMQQATKQTLPKKLGSHEEAFRALGFVATGSSDDLFNLATFPVGWKKVPTDHSLWTDLVDDMGRRRGTIFYKAAFYDRDASAYLVHRFGVDKCDGEVEGTVDIKVCDALGLVQRSIQGLIKPNWRGNRAKAQECDDIVTAAEDKIREWLTEQYPLWKTDVTAYWDV